MSKGWACIARLGGIGDNLISASVFPVLKKMGYMVEMIGAEPWHVVYLHNPHIDKLAIKHSSRDLPQGDMKLWQAWFASRFAEYDIAANLSHTGEVLHGLFEGSTDFHRPAHYRRKLCAGSYLEAAHDILGIPHDFGAPLYYASAEETERAKETKAKIGKRTIGWVLSGSRVDKIYPWSTQAIPRLIKELDAAVIQFGTGDQAIGLGQMIETDLKRTNSTLSGLHSAVSKSGTQPGEECNWPLRRSLALLLQCDLVITPDTGLAWAVAMERMPKIVMVSHASPENITKHWRNTTTLQADPYRVPCWPCHRLHDSLATCTPAKDHPAAAACMADISVERLMTTARQLWTEQSGRPETESELTPSSYSGSSPRYSVSLAPQ